MQNIHVKRFIGNTAAQGSITPEDRSWELVIDAEGFPHLWVRAAYDAGDGVIKHGMIVIDDFMHADTTVKGLMTECEFGGSLTPEEQDAAYDEYKAQCEAGKRPPCPGM